MNKLWITFSAAALLVTAAGSASAAPLTVQSYAMNNGAHGSFNYRDFTYLPCAGVCNTTNAALSGGTGKLTDGVSPALSWYQYGENTPWVGWDTSQGQLNPTVTFNFASMVTIQSVTIWVDDSLGAGGVQLPASVTIGATNHVITPDGINAPPRAYTFSGLGLTGSSVSLQFFHTPGFQWLMVGEVSFDGGTAIPEPVSLALLGTGFAALGLIRRRRNA